jgi:hypothetical protein
MNQETMDQASTSTSRLDSLARLFTFGAIGGIIAGLIHLASLLSNGYTSIGLGDVLFNMSGGVLAFICSRLLKNKKLLVIPLFAVIVLLSIVYGFLVGRGFNFIFTVIGLLILGGLISLWRSGELK